jgi:hypothetical protein
MFAGLRTLHTLGYFKVCMWILCADERVTAKPISLYLSYSASYCVLQLDLSFLILYIYIYIYDLGWLPGFSVP